MTAVNIAAPTSRLRLRTLRRLMVVAGTIAALTILAPSASASSHKPHKEFHLEKTCNGFTCLVTSSSFRGIPAGTTITYTGSSPDALAAVINAPHGTASGNCEIASVFADPSSPGRCTFDEGTGSLRRFHLDVAVTLDFATGVWHWDGTYHFSRHHCHHGHRR